LEFSTAQFAAASNMKILRIDRPILTLSDWDKRMGVNPAINTTRPMMNKDGRAAG